MYQFPVFSHGTENAKLASGCASITGEWTPTLNPDQPARTMGVNDAGDDPNWTGLNLV